MNEKNKHIILINPPMNVLYPVSPLLLKVNVALYERKSLLLIIDFIFLYFFYSLNYL